MWIPRSDKIEKVIKHRNRNTHTHTHYTYTYTYTHTQTHKHTQLVDIHIHKAQKSFFLLFFKSILPTSGPTAVLWTYMLSSPQGPQQGMLEGDFALCISLYHGYELLMQMGLRSLFFYIQGIMDGSRGHSPRFQAFSVFSSTSLHCIREHFFISSSVLPGCIHTH